MMTTSQAAEINALQQRIDSLERDLEHKREIISVLLDREARAQARLRAALTRE